MRDRRIAQSLQGTDSNKKTKRISCTRGIHLPRWGIRLRLREKVGFYLATVQTARRSTRACSGSTKWSYRLLLVIKMGQHGSDFPNRAGALRLSHSYGVIWAPKSSLNCRVHGKGRISTIKIGNIWGLGGLCSKERSGTMEPASGLYLACAVSWKQKATSIQNGHKAYSKRGPHREKRIERTRSPIKNRETHICHLKQDAEGDTILQAASSPTRTVI